MLKQYYLLYSGSEGKERKNEGYGAFRIDIVGKTEHDSVKKVFSAGATTRGVQAGQGESIPEIAEETEAEIQECCSAAAS